MKEKKLYSITGKLLVLFLLLVFTASAAFGTIQVLVLSGVGLTPNTAARKYTFERTTTCGYMVQKKLYDIMNYYNESSKFGTNGVYDGGKEIDFVSYASNGEESGGDATTYTVDQLLEMDGDGSSDTLNDLVGYQVETYASNDAGIDKKAYLAYEERLYGSDAGETGLETTETGSTEETALAEPSTEQQSFETFEPDGEIYMPSEEAQKSFQKKKLDWNQFSSQFLYLYDQGMNTETQKTKAGTYLYEYAAENPKTVSLRDLYRFLFTIVREAAEFKDDEASLVTSTAETNLWYCLEDAKGNIYTNVDAWKAGYETAIAQKTSYQFGLAMDRTGDTDAIRTEYKHNPSVESVKGYLQNDAVAECYQKILVVLDPQLTAGDWFSQYSEIFDQWEPKMPLLLWMIAVGGIGMLICLVLLTMQAGRNTKNKEIHLFFFDRWYTEIYFAVFLLAAFGAIAIVAVGLTVSYDSVNYIRDFSGNYVYGEYGNNADMWRTLVTMASILAGLLVGLVPYCSLVRRIKAHNIWQQSFLYQIGHSAVSVGRSFYEGRKESERTIILFCVFCGVQIVLCCGFGAFGVLLVLILDAAVLLLLMREASGRKQIEQGLKEIVAGDLEYKIDLTSLQGDENIQLAEIVNSLGGGLKAAVQEQMKSERLKADLITNVSHDIKTPLTSIINYVDLLKRENIENEKAKAYIRVLDEKSQRLKQLTEDLVEASKISSGNIKLEFMNLNLNELVQQVNGEFAERFESRNLDLICVLQPEPLLIRADSRRIWRVLENLYVNVCKYAMPGTRVYVDAVRKDGKVQFSIKNISENPLNFQADELTERFIRGDVSRSTEGSGLGLSIAKNLTVLQHGTFNVYLDGDLFKITITFDEVTKEKPRTTGSASEPEQKEVRQESERE